jgi:hypothetical protein
METVAYNNDISNWGRGTRQKLINSVKKLSQKGKGDLVKSIKLNTHKMYGLVDRLSYRFLRYGVFFHKGTGRGYKMTGGVVVRVPSAKNKTLNDSSIKREPVEWFNPVIDDNINDLANRVANHMADAAVNATRMKIN